MMYDMGLVHSAFMLMPMDEEMSLMEGSNKTRRRMSRCCSNVPTFFIDFCPASVVVHKSSPASCPQYPHLTSASFVAHQKIYPVAWPRDSMTFSALPWNVSLTWYWYGSLILWKRIVEDSGFIDSDPVRCFVCEPKKGGVVLEKVE